MMGGLILLHELPAGVHLYCQTAVLPWGCAFPVGAALMHKGMLVDVF